MRVLRRLGHGGGVDWSTFAHDEVRIALPSQLSGVGRVDREVRHGYLACRVNLNILKPAKTKCRQTIRHRKGQRLGAQIASKVFNPAPGHYRFHHL